MELCPRRCSPRQKPQVTATTHAVDKNHRIFSVFFIPSREMIWNMRTRFSVCFIPPRPTSRSCLLLSVLQIFRYTSCFGWPPLCSSGQSYWLQIGDVLCFLWGTNWIYICHVEESRPPPWSRGQSSWLQNGDVLCFLWGTNWIYMSCRRK
jgi:hypothetical protein